MFTLSKMSIMASAIRLRGDNEPTAAIEPQDAKSFIYLTDVEGDLNKMIKSLKSSKLVEITWHKSKTEITKESTAKGISTSEMIVQTEREFPTPTAGSERDRSLTIQNMDKSLVSHHAFADLRTQGLLKPQDCANNLNACPFWPRLRFSGQGVANVQFVFGGDLWDQNAADIRLGTMMIDFHDAYKADKRVILIAGNRDILKMRYVMNTQKDLADAWWAEKLVIQEKYWPEKKRESQTYQEHITEELNKCDQDAKCLAKINLSMRFAQQHATMGAQNAILHRMRELVLLKELTLGQIGGQIGGLEQYVADHFMHMAGKDGLYRQYLERATLVHKIGSTLFAHGSVNKRNMKLVPKRHTDVVDFNGDWKINEPLTINDVDINKYFDTVENPAEWMKQLNQFYAARINEWTTVAAVPRKQRNGMALCTYMLGQGIDYRTVVESNHVDGMNFVSEDKENLAQGVHWALDPELIAHLKLMDVKRFVGGHKPVGETGAIYRTIDKEYMAIDLDMNYGKGSYARIEVDDTKVDDTKDEIVGMLGQETMELCNFYTTSELESTACDKEYHQNIAVDNNDLVGFEHNHKKFPDSKWKSRVMINNWILLSKGQRLNKTFGWVPLSILEKQFVRQ